VPWSVTAFQQHGPTRRRKFRGQVDVKAGGELKSLLAHTGDDTAVMVTDAADKTATEVITLRQQVEHLLDYMGTYTREDLLKLCHAYMLKHPAAQVLVEYGVMSRLRQVWRG